MSYSTWGTCQDRRLLALFFYIVSLGLLGVPAIDARAAGQSIPPPPVSVQWADVWGTSSHDVFVVGNSGVVVHFNGTAWEKQRDDVSDYLHGIWGASGREIHAVGAFESEGDTPNGFMVHFDGHTWTRNTGRFEALYAVWGTSPTDVFAVGDNGTIVHKGASGWETIKSPTAQALADVWGSSRTDVFAVGHGGAILHYDGRRWTTMLNAPGEGFSGVWGTSKKNVFAVGNDTHIFQYNGRQWRTIPFAQNAYIGAVWGASKHDIFFGGSRIMLHYDGKNLTTMEGMSEGFVDAVWGTSANDVWAVGSNEIGRGFIAHYNGRQWIRVQ